MKRALSAASLIAACAAFSQAQPSHVMVGMGGGDISSDGMIAVGPLYNAAVQQYRIYRYVRGVGGTDTGAVFNDNDVRSSADCTAFSYGAYNLENFGNFGTNRIIAHRWTQANGPMNIGAPANATP